MRVGRVYTFQARHHLAGLPFPWCEPHRHTYRIEVVFDRPTKQGFAVDHEALDERWRALQARVADADLNALYPLTTVEALAYQFREWFGADEVTVWEDDDRWATA